LKVILPSRQLNVWKTKQPSYQEVVKSKIVIEKVECRLHGQHFYLRHRSFHELVEFVKAMHEISYCTCGNEWPFFEVYPYKEGEGLIIK